MKLAVVTITCGDFYSKVSELTHPTIRNYARRIGADFIVWNDYDGHICPHYKKLEIADLLQTYDRVLYVDTDIIIHPRSPNIFDEVSEGKLGIFDESPFQDRRETFKKLMTRVGLDPGTWDGRYYNTGVIVASREHSPLFTPPPFEFDHFYEQSYLNLMISHGRPPVHRLHPKWNFQKYLEDQNVGFRLDSFFLHYAGVAIGDPNLDHFLGLIRNDLWHWGVFS